MNGLFGIEIAVFITTDQSNKHINPLGEFTIESFDCKQFPNRASASWAKSNLEKVALSSSIQIDLNLTIVIETCRRNELIMAHKNCSEIKEKSRCLFPPLNLYLSQCGFL